MMADPAETAPAAEPSAPASGGSDSPAPAAPAEHGNEETMTREEQDDVASTILRFDPFEAENVDADGVPKALSKGKEGEPPPASADGSPPADPATPAIPGEAPTGVQPPAADPTGEVAALIAQNTELTKTVQSLLAGQQQPQPQAPGGTTQQQAQDAKLATYDFTLNPKVVQMLRSEDPGEFAAAIKSVLQGTAKSVHQRLRAEMRRYVSDTVPPMIQSTQDSSNSARAVFEDFYDTYKTLNVPELHSFVTSVAASVMQETGQQSWTPQLKKQIADRVFQLVPGLNTQAPAAPTAPAAPANPAPPVQFGSSNRPAPVNSGRLEHEIADTLGF